MVKLIHKERIAEGSTRRFLDGRRNDAPLRKGMVAKFRESHHVLAKLMAKGLKQNDIAARTGYSETWIAQLHNDPAFQELLTKYRDLDTQLFVEGRDEFYTLATKNMIQAERQLSDKMDDLDEEGEMLPTRELVSIVADRADRFGYGKRETKFNVKVDFADALQRAIKRSGKTVDGTLNEGFGGMKLLASSEANSTVPQFGVEPKGTSEDPSPVSGESLGLERPHVRKHGDMHASDTGHHHEGHRPLGRAQQPQTLSLSALGSAGGSGFPARSVEASQREMVLPGAVESRPLRRRLLG